MDIKELLNNPIVTLLGHIVGLLGLILACIFYFRSKRDKEPHWAIQTVNLFTDYSGTVGGLEIQYAGEKVRDLSVSKLAFWNHGALTINSEDLVRTDPLRIETKGTARVLSTKLISNNNNASQPLLSAPPEKNCAFLNFDYLDRGQGFVVQIIHEGTSSSDLEVKGSIKGVSRIRKIDLKDFVNKTKKERIKHHLLQITVLVLLWSWAALSFYGAWKDGGYAGIVLLVFGLFILAGGIAGGKQIFLLASRQVPPGLESFYTDPRQPATQIAVRI